MRFFIRAIHAGDQAACARLFGIMRSEIYEAPFLPGGPETAWRADTRGERVFVAQNGTCLVGFASLWPDPPFLHLLAVDPGFRRHGVARALTQAVMKAAGGPVDLKVDPWNAGALAFYDTLGGRVVDRHDTGPAPWIRVRIGAL